MCRVTWVAELNDGGWVRVERAPVLSSCPYSPFKKLASWTLLHIKSFAFDTKVSHLTTSPTLYGELVQAEQGLLRLVR